MKTKHILPESLLIICLSALWLVRCQSPGPSPDTMSEFASVSQVESGTPVGVQMTAYRTTLVADGKDYTLLRATVIDEDGKEITSADNTLQIYIVGEGWISRNGEKESLPSVIDTSGNEYFENQLENGYCLMDFHADAQPGKTKVEIRSDTLWPASHELHTIPSDVKLLLPDFDLLETSDKKVGRMIGADISFLPQLEARGRTFFQNGMEKDAIELLRDHGFNYIRLRIFVNPENEKGYSPETGFCGLSYTLGMAKRVKEAGMKLLLNFHYSDYWADPQQQNKPLAWSELDLETLKDSMKQYTSNVLLVFQKQGTPVDMVQVGNEINHGLLWPDGHISHPDKLAELLKAGVEGVTAVDPDLPIMMHIALGGQHEESVFWLDNMIARGVEFDVIGISYYPRWHGTLDDLKYNLVNLSDRYKKYLNVVEYSIFKKEVHDIVFNLPGDLGQGTCIWEPLGTRWGDMFDENGKVREVIRVYDELSYLYLADEQE
jgi:hypothetical protein